MKKPNRGTAIALGVGIGAALGVAFDDISMGVALGAAFGVALGGVVTSRNKKSDDR